MNWPKNVLYERVKGAQEAAEIHRKALRRRKNLAFGYDTCVEKETVMPKVTQRKVGVGLKRRGS